MDTSHINKVKTPQHFKTRRSHRGLDAFGVARVARVVQEVLVLLREHVHRREDELVEGVEADVACAERLGPNGLKLDKKTTQRLLSWRRIVLRK